MESRTESVGSMLFQVGKAYPRLALAYAPLLFLFVLIKDCNVFHFTLMKEFPGNCLQLLLLFYLYCFGYVLAPLVLSHQPVSYKDQFRRTLANVFSLVLFVVFIACFFLAVVHVVGFVLHFLTHDPMWKSKVFLFLAFFFSFPFLYLFTLFFLVIPLMMIDNCSLFDALQLAPQLTQGHLFKVFQLVACLMFFYLLTSSGTRHYNWLLQHSLNIPVDFIVLLLFLPLFYGATFLLLDFLKGSDDVMSV